MIIVRLDQDRKGIFVGDGYEELSPSEYKLCEFLMRRPGHVRSRREMMDACDFEWDIDERSVDSAIKRLRKRLRRLGVDPIVTRYGFGYSWTDLR